jgi:hypothetical protein
MPAVCGHIESSYPAIVLWAGWEAVIRWWDGVELWLTQLALPLQVALLMLVLLPVCGWTTRAIDRTVDLASERLGHRSNAEPTADAQDIAEQP